MWYSDFFPKSRPRKAKGGIRAQSGRGAFGKSWWAKRWVAVLEGFNIGARLGRGRSYARNGQVLSIDVSEGEVKAEVQGSQRDPYDVTIVVQTLTAAEWRKVLEALAGQALFVAKLLAGEMPQDIEQVFEAANLSLFPERYNDLTTDCSCPDWSNPCKHVAAVYYLLGEEFDRDPFLLFRLRGLGRDELVKRLGRVAPPPEAQAAAEPAEPLPAEAAAFWSAAALPDDVFGEVRTPSASAGWPKRLGSFPFWRGQQRFLEALESTYRGAAERGLNAFLGGPESKPDAPARNERKPR